MCNWIFYLLCLSSVVIVHSDQDVLLSGIKEVKDGPDRLPRIVERNGVKGLKGTIPCDITDHFQSLALILWFKGSNTEPIYSIDLRNGSPSTWSSPEVLGGRGSHSLNTTAAALNIDPLEELDEGLYRCRLDYKDKPTTNHKINFNVTVLPGLPVIWNIGGGDKPKALNTAFDEGADVSLLCRVQGGKPRPRVIWRMNNQTLDETYEYLERSDTTVNRLQMRNITRKYIRSMITCEASNTDIVPPYTTEHLIDLNLPPLSVEILTKEPYLSADRKYDVECRSTGSRPPAKISWLKRNRPLTDIATNYAEENSTVSVLSLIASPSDDGAYLTCSAHNPKLLHHPPIYDKWRLEVHYMPSVKISFGSEIKADAIREGDSVYMKCDIKANPKPQIVTWYKDNALISQSDNIRISGLKLLIDGVRGKEDSGSYRCEAQNSEGRGISTTLTMKVQFVPVCRVDSIKPKGVLPNETIVIHCDVSGNPAVQNITWNLEKHNETIRLNGSSMGNISYRPVSEADYGLLSCMGENEMGVQREPCLYRLIPIGHPMRPEYCNVTDVGSTNLQVECNRTISHALEGDLFDETFNAVAIDIDAKEVVERVEQKENSFLFVNLSESTLYLIEIRKSNIRGISEPYNIRIKTLPEWRISVGSVLLIAALVFIVISTGAIIFYLLCRYCNFRRRRKRKKISLDDVSIEAREVQASALLEAERRPTTTIRVIESQHRASSLQSEGFVDCADESSITPDLTLAHPKTDNKNNDVKESLIQGTKKSFEELTKYGKYFSFKQPMHKTNSLGRETCSVGVTCKLGHIPIHQYGQNRNIAASLGALRESYI